MNALDSLDLSGLAQFRATDLLLGGTTEQAAGTPMQAALDLIDFDPLQPRRTVYESTIAELAESIRAHGVLEPISLRSHPEQQERYIVNRGERRVRAARRAGLASIPAFLDERVDPFAQAAENLHRENMSPFDLARFIVEREREGHSRAEIARRLNKPRSFVTEAASLADAPADVQRAFEEGRVGGDIRMLYRLVVAKRRKPIEIGALLAGAGAITRANVDEIMGRAMPADPLQAEELPAGSIVTGRAISGGRTVLVVEHSGRRASLRLKAQDKDVGEVRFGDGSRSLVALADLRPVCWATEE